MDADRIQKTEKEIERILPERPEYVVSTSEYRDMRERLLKLEGRRKSEDRDGRPQLRRREADPNSGEDADKERPTVRRRDLIE
jgi:hypothetical protein